jgi:hypothetical protein
VQWLGPANALLLWAILAEGLAVALTLFVLARHKPQPGWTHTRNVRHPNGDITTEDEAGFVRWFVTLSALCTCLPVGLLVWSVVKDGVLWFMAHWWLWLLLFVVGFTAWLVIRHVRANAAAQQTEPAVQAPLPHDPMPRGPAVQPARATGLEGGLQQYPPTPAAQPVPRWQQQAATQTLPAVPAQPDTSWLKPDASDDFFARP